MQKVVKNAPWPMFKCLSLIHLAMAAALLFQLLMRFGASHEAPYLFFSGLLVAFIVAQLLALKLFHRAQDPKKATWLLTGVLLVCVTAMPLFIRHAPLLCGFYLAAVPLFFAATNQLKDLPTVLFLTLVTAAGTIFFDLILPFERSLLVKEFRQVQLVTAICFGGYTCVMAALLYFQRRHGETKLRFKINVATQYALVITGISTMVIVLVTGALTSQIRRAQIDQVGKNFQTIAENFAKLVGSNLEQQTQKLQLLSQQVPVFREGLLQANAQYAGDHAAARELLVDKNHRWVEPDQNADFVMAYLNNPLNLALSRFRGHNNFHKDIVVVDAYGGLVASLGKTPEKFYFFDEEWWQVSWNGGLGNIFIGNPVLDRPDKVPMLRLAVDIIDHTTNDVIGMLSSKYLMGTLLDDIVRFKPDSVDQISLVDADGRVIASTLPEMVDQPVWSNLSSALAAPSRRDAGWVLGRDHLGQSALIGYSSLSTVYNVISDPLHRLHWHMVVSGTRANALRGVTNSTKLAMLLGLVVIALGVLCAMAAARVITQPIEDLTATASAMSEGDLDNRAALTGPDELVTLSSGFNRLTDRLRHVIHNLQSQSHQLVAAKREAETATQLKGQFLANMSHEIRTPLNAILGFADLLEAEITDNQLKRHARTIRSSGTDLLHLINDILDLSKIEAGRMEIQREAVNLRHLFEELQGIFSIAAQEKKLTFDMGVSNEVPQGLMLDRSRLRQILFNLLGNALKFTEHGEVSCHASAVKGRSARRWDLSIEVRDTGIGIDPSVHNAIFDSFNQHHDPAQPTGMTEGTGLGLSITKSLVEMMEGEIRVAGAKGKGTCFTLHLPDRTETEAEVPEAACWPAKALEGQNVRFEPASLLIVDDLAVNRDLIKEALRATSLAVEEVTNGLDAVAMVREKTFDLVLMDIRMPDMNGYEALERIRKDRGAAVPPIIALTASGMKEDVIRIQEAGFDDFLIRPFDQTALQVLLAQYLPTADGGKRSVDGEGEEIPAELDLSQMAPWTCPPSAHEQLLGALKHQWQIAKKKQSIPDIVAFATAVEAIGNQHDISVLSRYGNELAGHADAFDIKKMEQLLGEYEKILDLGIAPTPASDPLSSRP
jgi:signal transduction histidine kinase/DNA-binding response OmpR family regulator